MGILILRWVLRNTGSPGSSVHFAETSAVVDRFRGTPNGRIRRIPVGMYGYVLLSGFVGVDGLVIFLDPVNECSQII